MSAIPAAFTATAARITASGFISDPWLFGEPRFSSEPVVLDVDEHQQLCQAGEDLCAVINEAVQLLCEHDDQRAQFLPLTNAQALMLEKSRGLWHGLARADVFFTEQGLQVTELNSDTPTGEPEAIVMGALGKEDHPTLHDACAMLPSRLVALWETMLAQCVDAGAQRTRTAAIIYPTEFTEDLSLVRLYRRLLEERGFHVVLGSPFNVVGDDDGVTVFGERPTLVLRHYKTDWWSEREGAWLDEELDDKAALDAPLQALLSAEEKRQLVVVNPFGAVASQSKRLLAFCWERLHRFPIEHQQIIQRLIPYTARLEAVHEEQLVADKDNWVLKSDYGAEGEEVIVGKATDDATWRASLRLARPGRWVAQRFFHAKTHERGLVRNCGVFVVGGEACGVYTRLDNDMTTASSLSVPTLVRI